MKPWVLGADPAWGGQVTRRQQGVRVLVTRARHQGGGLVDHLIEAGFTVVHLPLLVIASPSDPTPLLAALAVTEPYDWVVFTSRNAVERTCLAGSRRPWRRALALAAGTATACAEQGLVVDALASSGEAEGVLASLAAQPPSRILLPQADNARPFLAAGLRDQGHAVTAVEAYRSCLPHPPPALPDPPCSLVALASAASVDRYVACMRGDERVVWSSRGHVAIGRHTAARITSAGLRLAGVAQEASDAGLARACVAAAAAS